MVVAGNAEKFTTQERKTSLNSAFNSARDVEREELKEENRLQRQCARPWPNTLSPGTPDRDVCCGHRSTQKAGGVAKPERKFRGDIEGPGRVREGRPKPKSPAGASTATPNGVPRMYKTGDPELGLDVSKLNAFAAMQARGIPYYPPSSAPAPPLLPLLPASSCARRYPSRAGDHDRDGLRRGSGRRGGGR